jgi:hypothetical protein
MKQTYSLQEKAWGYVQNRHVFSYLWTELAQAQGGLADGVAGAPGE